MRRGSCPARSISCSVNHALDNASEPGESCPQRVFRVTLACRRCVPPFRAPQSAMSSEVQVYQLECELIALAAGVLLIAFVLRRLKRVQPGIPIAKAIWIAFGIRIVVALLLNQTPIAGQLRGGDEGTFLYQAESLARWDFISHGTWDGLTKSFHVFFFSLDDRLFNPVNQMTMRIQIIAIAVAGLALISAAVYELAGRKAALITAWILAFEPTGVFFAGILHKEPFMLLAEGMVAYGGAKLWKRGDFSALVPMTIGCLLAVATRPYAGWFLSMAAAAIALHVGLKRRASPARSLVLVAIVLGLAVAFVPAVWNASSKDNLKQLQSSQDFNAHGVDANLSLERVDYSTRDKIILNLPKRILDIATKPYPWQLGNTSQRLGVLGTTFMFVGLIFLAAALLTNGKEIMRRAGPLVYPALFLLIAYSISAGNAGTAFRYRTHLVAFLVAVLVVLRTARQERRAAVRERTRVARIQPIIARGQTT